MSDVFLRIWIWQRCARAQISSRLIRDDRGEGVISAAIAVLIMAFLGVGLWLAFRATLQGATSNVDRQVTNLGR